MSYASASQKNEGVKRKAGGAVPSSALCLSPETSGGFAAEPQFLLKFTSNQVLSLGRARPVISPALQE